MASGTILKPINRDERYALGSAVTITNYTSSAYTCPQDGYIYLGATSDGSYINVKINNKLDFRVSCSSITGNMYNCLYVKKGMTILVTYKSGNAYAFYYPLLDN